MTDDEMVNALLFVLLFVLPPAVVVAAASLLSWLASVLAGGC